MTTEIVGSLNREQAQDLTDQIKTTTEALWVLLTRAWEGKAWEVLGYDTWAAYVQGEFAMSRQRSHQLLNHGVVIHQLTAAAGLSTVVDTPVIPEGQTRIITPEKLPQVVAKVRTQVANGVEAREAIDTAVTETIDERKAAIERAAFEAFQDPTRQLEKMNASIEAFWQEWMDKRLEIVPVIERIHGKRDVGIEIGRLSKNIDKLMEIRETMQGSLAREVLL